MELTENINFSSTNLLKHLWLAPENCQIGMVSKNQVIPNGMPSQEAQIVEITMMHITKFHRRQGKQWNLFDLLDCLSPPCTNMWMKLIAIVFLWNNHWTNLNVTNLSLIIWNLLSDINSGSSRTASSTHTTIFLVWKM